MDRTKQTVRKSAPATGGAPTNHGSEFSSCDGSGEGNGRAKDEVEHLTMAAMVLAITRAKDEVEHLTLAMVLAITAPNDECGRKAEQMVDAIAQGLPRAVIERCAAVASEQAGIDHVPVFGPAVVKKPIC